MAGGLGVGACERLDEVVGTWSVLQESVPESHRYSSCDPSYTQSFHVSSLVSPISWNSTFR